MYPAPSNPFPCSISQIVMHEGLEEKLCAYALELRKCHFYEFMTMFAQKVLDFNKHSIDANRYKAHALIEIYKTKTDQSPLIYEAIKHLEKAYKNAKS